MKKNKHDSDCSFFSALDNGTPDCGVCTCGFGLQKYRESMSLEYLYSPDRIRSVHAMQDGKVDAFSATTWSLELAVKHKTNLRRLVNWLYQEEVFDFHWEHQGGTPKGDLIILTINGHWSYNLESIAKVLGDYSSDLDDGDEE